MKCSMACRNRIRNTLISIVTFALGLCLFESSHAQSYESKADQEATQIVATKESNGSRVDRDAIRPFRVNIPKEALVDLRRRIAATRWPDKETVTDRDLATRGHHGVSRGGLSSPGNMGAARLSQPDLLQRSRQGRALRRVGAPTTFFGRDP